MQLLKSHVFKATSFDLLVEYHSHLTEKQVYCLDSCKNFYKRPSLWAYIQINVYKRDWVGPDGLWGQVPSPTPTSSLPAQPVQRARIEYYVFARTFCLDRSLKFSIYFYLTAWHDVEQNKCKRDPQIANNNKMKVSSSEINFQAFFVSAMTNRDVAIQNWWHF